MEKGIEEHHKKQMMQDNALRLEAILNGESVQNFGILRACIDAVFSQLRCVRSHDARFVVASQHNVPSLPFFVHCRRHTQTVGHFFAWHSASVVLHGKLHQTRV